MPWIQNVDPLDWPLGSALVATLPLVLFGWALAIRRLPGTQAAALMLGSASALAWGVLGMPVPALLGAALQGALYGMLPIGWVVYTAVLLYNLVVASGRLDVLQQTLRRAARDPIPQVLLIAFCFGAFLEGAAGFGTPVAIGAAMLIGLGFAPLEAAVLALLANTAPVAYGGIGLPVLVGAELAGLNAQDVTRACVRLLPVLSLSVPFLLAFWVDGRNGLRHHWPEALACALGFTLGQAGVAWTLGPQLADMAGAVLGAAGVLVVARARTPQALPDTLTTLEIPRSAQARAWGPFVLLSLLVGLWGLPAVRRVLDPLGWVLPVPGLEGAILKAGSGTLVPGSFRLAWASTPGTAIVLAALGSVWLLGLRAQDGLRVAGQTFVQLRRSLLTIAGVLSFASVASASGLSETLGRGLASTGDLFPLLSPLLGWLGVVLTGSDTSSNALFCGLQRVTGDRLGLDSAWLVAANTVGGGAGKMLSLQSIAVAAGTVGLVGMEGTLLRRTWPFSLGLAFAVGVAVWSWIQSG